MAVTVTTDLSSGLIVDASNSNSFAEPTGSGSVSGDNYADFKSFQDESDVYIQGIASTSAAHTTNQAQRGCLVTDSGAPGLTLAQDGAILVWQWWISPSGLDTYANAGQFIAVGSAQSDLEIFAVGGNNLDPAPLGGWYCYAVDPRVATVYETVGTPDSTTFRWIGGGVDAPQQARGLTHYAIDAIRHGRCTAVITGGTPDGTFIDISNVLQKGAEAGGGLVSYGVFDNVAGAFYMQGLLQFGTDATAVSFTDSNKVINIRNTPAVGPNFNRVEIRNAASTINLTGCSFANIGIGNPVATTASLGDLAVIASAATVNIINCGFSDWGTFSWGSGTTLSSTAFRRCGQITQNSATITNCIFDNSSSPLVVNSTLSTCTFVGDGTTTPGHAVDLGTRSGGTSGTPIEYIWNSTLDNGTTNQSEWEGSTQTPTTTNNGDANSAITVNIPNGSFFKIAVQGSGTIPTVNVTGGGSLEITANEVTLTLTGIVAESQTNIDGGAESSEVRIYSAGTSTELAGIEDIVETTGGSKISTFGYTYTYSANTFVDIRVFHKSYKPVVLLNYELEEGNVQLPISQIFDRNYSNP